MGQAWAVIAIFVFVFILWVSTGGPTKPISFAGPYITPITDVGDVQGGYGEDIDIGTDNKSSESGSRIWSVKSVVGRFENRLGSGANVGPVSPLADRVRIVSGAGGPSGSDTKSEYIVIRSTSESAVDVTGWRIVSKKSGASVTIPQAERIARSGALANVVLNEGDEVVITTGGSPSGASFRENKCAGYLDNDRFVPALATRSCPAPLDELGDFFPTNAPTYEACRDVVHSFARCEEPRNVPREASSECKNFINTRLNYQGCVLGHSKDADFFGRTWRVFLGRSAELWRSDNEALKLLDREGRTVDVYSY
jgi:hypothetical protein